jgi:hypothetical protein
MLIIFEEVDSVLDPINEKALVKFYLEFSIISIKFSSTSISKSIAIFEQVWLCN